MPIVALGEHIFFEDTARKRITILLDGRKIPELELNNNNNKMPEIVNNDLDEGCSCCSIENKNSSLSFDLFNINPVLPRKNHQYLSKKIKVSDLDDIWEEVALNLFKALVDKKL